MAKLFFVIKEPGVEVRLVEAERLPLLIGNVENADIHLAQAQGPVCVRILENEQGRYVVQKIDPRRPSGGKVPSLEVEDRTKLKTQGVTIQLFTSREALLESQAPAPAPAPATPPRVVVSPEVRSAGTEDLMQRALGLMKQLDQLSGRIDAASERVRVEGSIEGA